MNRESLISVIVPIYNVQDYLKKCVDSILNQTYKNLEIILVDDGSTDESPLICDQYAKQEKRVRVIHKTNGGLSSARNAGLDIANGDFIGFVDSDDYIDLSMYEKLLIPFSSNDNIGVTMGQVKRVEDGRFSDFMLSSKCNRLVKSKDFSLLSLSWQICVAVWCKLFRADLLRTVRFREGKLNEDSLFSFDLSLFLEKCDLNVFVIPDVIYFYIVRKGSICFSKRPLHIDILENLNYIENEYRKMGDPRYLSVHHIYNAVLFQFNRAMLDFTSWYKDYTNPYYYDFCNLSFRDFICSPKNMIVPYQFFALKYFRDLYRVLLKCKKILML